jgi:hypothetical protein
MKTYLNSKVVCLYVLPPLLMGNIGYCLLTMEPTSEIVIKAGVYGLLCATLVGILIRFLFVFERSEYGFTAYSWYGSMWFFEWDEITNRRSFKLLGADYVRIDSVHGGVYYAPAEVARNKDS